MTAREQRTGSAMTRRAAAIVLVAASAGCGSLSVNGTGAGAGPARSTAPGAATGCTTASLRVTLDTGAAGAAAGTSFVPLDFTNISGGTCHLSGFPVVSFAASPAGRQVGATAVPDRSVAVRSVLLPPGATAHAWLQITDALNYPAKQCHPVTAAGLRVNLPGQDAVRYLKHQFPACAGTANGSDALVVQPIQSGRARHGTAQ
jgi:hypothetical protein